MFYKKIINKILNKFGYQIQKINTKLKLPIEFSQDELNLVTSIEDYTMTGRIRIISGSQKWECFTDARDNSFRYRFDS